MWYYTIYFIFLSFVSLTMSVSWARNSFLDLGIKTVWIFIFIWSVFFALLNSGFIVHV